jgi:hypothetical protein
MTPTNDEDWQPICDASTPYSALAEIVNDLTEWALNDFAETLKADGFRGDMAPVLARLRPDVREKTKAAVESGWLSLQPRQ